MQTVYPECACAVCIHTPRIYAPSLMIARSIHGGSAANSRAAGAIHAEGNSRPQGQFTRRSRDSSTSSGFADAAPPSPRGEGFALKLPPWGNSAAGVDEGFTQRRDEHRPFAETARRNAKAAAQNRAAACRICFYLECSLIAPERYACKSSCRSSMRSKSVLPTSVSATRLRVCGV